MCVCSIHVWSICVCPLFCAWKTISELSEYSASKGIIVACLIGILSLRPWAMLQHGGQVSECWCLLLGAGIYTAECSYVSTEHLHGWPPINKWAEVGPCGCFQGLGHFPGHWLLTYVVTHHCQENWTHPHPTPPGEVSCKLIPSFFLGHVPCAFSVFWFSTIISHNHEYYSFSESWESLQWITKPEVSLRDTWHICLPKKSLSICPSKHQYKRTAQD